MRSTTHEERVAGRDTRKEGPMGTVNRVILVGNLGRDAELRFTGTGTPVAKFSVATTETYKGRDGEKKEETEWHRVNLWGKSAETLAQYLVKGKQVYVEGRLRTRSYDDKDQQKRYVTEVVCDELILLSNRSEGAPSEYSQERAPAPPPRPAARPQAAAAPPEDFNQAISDDDVPF
jgi:single-strand DNA-binding protein